MKMLKPIFYIALGGTWMLWCIFCGIDATVLDRFTRIEWLELIGCAFALSLPLAFCIALGESPKP